MWTEDDWNARREANPKEKRDWAWARRDWVAHAVCGVAYTPEDVTVITWGYEKRMTWEFFEKCNWEGYAVLSRDWLKQLAKRQTL